MDIKLGNIVYLLNGDGSKKPVKVMGVKMRYRMDGSLAKTITTYVDEKVLTDIPMSKIEGIALTDENLMKIKALKSEQDSAKNKYGNVYIVESDIDTCIKIT